MQESPMQAKDIMTTRVHTVRPETTVAEIAALLLANHISAVPVVDEDNHVLGIVSEGDLMRRPESQTVRHRSWWLALWTLPEERAVEYAKAHGRHAGDVMTRNVVSIDEDTPLDAIAALLETHRIKRVPVVHDGRLVGIVSRANLLHGLTHAAPAGEAADGADNRTIRERVMAQLLDDLGVGPGRVNAMVADGVVDLWGEADSEEEKRAIFIAAENTPGVRQVNDHIFVLSPSLRAYYWAE
jgi:CBS domain-containing protein